MKIRKLMLHDSHTELTIEVNTENTVFVTVGSGLIFQSVDILCVSLRETHPKSSCFGRARYEMTAGAIRYDLEPENLYEISKFLGVEIDRVINDKVSE